MGTVSRDVKQTGVLIWLAFIEDSDIDVSASSVNGS